jgi:uncharacterized membrane protein YphA (DoxX/SURF4 family)
MSAGFAGRPAQLWLSTLARVALGLVMVIAGGLKISDPDQAVRAVQAYQILPQSMTHAVGYGLPLLEITLGLLLLLGLGTRIAALLAGLFMIVFIAAVSSAWARGLSIDCGCFGGGGAIDPAGKTWRYLSEILRDLLFLGLASWIAVFKASRFALDPAPLPSVGTDDPDDSDDSDDSDNFEDSRA